ncbi:MULTISPECIES: hypothetical protein [unclassified Aliivibrio]|uniref:hypothetical protein n=1 Tax=unclassified Aliivibrio TaxID=2645654 RepID=UPI0011472BE3|nr:MULTISPECIES: hypothetical protein [unclassified Aliivibrio]
MTLPECDENNFYSIKLTCTDGRRLLVRGISGDEITALEYCKEERSFDVKTKIDIRNVDLNNIEITYYLYNYYSKFTSLNAFIIDYIFKKECIRITVSRSWKKLSQVVFNCKRLQSRPRHELIEHIIEAYGITNKEFCLTSLMTDIYSLRSFGHPNKEKCMNKLRLYLKSFEESGEIIVNHNGNYKITGKAIVTLEYFQINERRHKDGLKLQYSMIILTALLAILASIQAGLIKLKPILDLTQ